MVNNRYTGVGYEPPFETPSDNDFMAAHIESLEARIRVLEDALKWALDNVTDEYANDVTEYYQKLKWASNTLEVK
jgi:hypothetical protein